MKAPEELVYRRMCELWASGDADALVELLAEDGVYHNLPHPPMEGREALRSWLSMAFKRWIVEVEILHLARDGEWVLSERLDTHVEGDRRIPLPVMNISRIVDGKVALWRDYYDTQMCKDLGLA
jgi:limonene-1,2-epoxide hydrolase